MQYLTIFAGLLVTDSVSAILHRRQTNTWSVTNFLASGSPYSSETSYSLDITDGTLATHCGIQESTLPEFSPYVHDLNCTNPAFTWSFSGAPDATGAEGYLLNITEANPASPDCVFVGQKWFPATALVTVTNPTDPDPNFDYPDLEVAPNFLIPYVEVQK